MELKDFQACKERVIKYFTEDKRVKYLMLVQALKLVTTIVVLFPTEIGMYSNNPELRTRLVMGGLVAFLISEGLIIWGLFDKFFAWWFKVPILRKRWRECSSFCWVAAFGFYNGCRSTWLLMLPGLALLFLCFHLDYKRLKAEEDK